MLARWDVGVVDSEKAWVAMRALGRDETEVGRSVVDTFTLPSCDGVGGTEKRENVEGVVLFRERRLFVECGDRLVAVDV